MNTEQFDHALSLTRCRGKSAEAARLHLVDGFTMTEAASHVGITKQTVSRTVESINKQIEGVKMSAKKLGIYLADDSLAFLKIIQDEDQDINLSTAVNLAIQFAKLVTQEPLPLSADELLLCCDVLNPGANLTGFETPDSVSIENAMESMKFGLHEAQHHEEGIFEKWDVDPQKYHTNIESLKTDELFTLAIATRQFWKSIPVGDNKPVSECDGYRDWAKQWVE